MTNPGVFTISLDFELYWGTRDHRSLDDYGANILGGREAIPRILALFEEFEVHATWAVVGSLCFQGPSELAENLPPVLPRYTDRRLEPFDALSHLTERERAYYFAPELVELVHRTPHQEIGSHTFSHYYCLERGQTAEMFRSDLEAMRKTTQQKLRTEPKSLVFPRNQFTSRYLELCASSGIQAYRGNQHSWVYEPRNGDDESLARRAVRLVDSYVNLTGHHGHELPSLAAGSPIDVRASRFLRPYSRRLRFLEPLRLARIRADLRHAARKGLLYHLWWHPDNFGTRTDENLAFLRRVLECYRTLASERGMKSLNMSEAADHARARGRAGSDRHAA
ncbi:MAG TPA: polysaccharide deacetylase family protein [Polyangiaceae bacterium]|jgi:peptidoglycan/xylan/chitin deacetylase (PgdA/CDA1 family)|nr:polysaccharide deacetylase family protein [Polyangiaceae bacterium]